MKRYGQLIEVDEASKDLYIEYHRNVPQKVAELIGDCNIRNYSIFIKDNLLFAYFEYVGNDFTADMKKMDDNEDNMKWWKIVRPLQKPISTAKQGEFWADMEEIFFQA